MLKTTKINCSRHQPCLCCLHPPFPRSKYNSTRTRKEVTHRSENLLPPSAETKPLTKQRCQAKEDASSAAHPSLDTCLRQRDGRGVELESHQMHSMESPVINPLPEFTLLSSPSMPLFCSCSHHPSFPRSKYNSTRAAKHSLISRQICFHQLRKPCR